MSNKDQTIQSLEMKIKDMSEDSPTGGYLIRPQASNSRQEMIKRYNRNVVGNWKESK